MSDAKGVALAVGIRISPRTAAGIAVGAALVVAAAWCGRAQPSRVATAVEATVAVRITPHDALGLSGKPLAVREAPRVRAIVEALGVDAHPPAPCPSDYSNADVGMLLAGRDVYARRNVYVWNLDGEAGVPRVLVVTSSGCRGGAPADVEALRREITAAALRDGGARR